ncbi:MAG: methyltransferase domain-containing protein [Verrucomicrobiales bacterium]
MTPDWEQHYLDHRIPWEKGAPAPPLLEWLEANPDTVSGSVLVPGCGFGHDVRALARETDADFVVGLDVAETAIARCREFDTVGAERYVVGDLFDLGPEHREAYDWVWEHTCFCAVDPERRRDYVEAVRRALKPGGCLLGVFFLDPYDDEHRPGQGPPHGTSVYELKARFAHSGKFRIEDLYVPRRSYPGREEKECVLRMTKLGTRRASGPDDETGLWT